MGDKSKFAILILTHGRPHHVRTFDSLRRSGYTGPIYLVIDNEDETGDQYRDAFGPENVFEFDKEAVAKTVDTGDTNPSRRSTLFVRTALTAIAKELGLDYYAQFDDDYTNFSYRYIRKNKMLSHTVRNFDKIITLMLDLLEDTNALTVALSQGGDHIGGILGNYRKGVLRKAMNSQFVRTDRPIQFLGRLNEDVNPYVVHGSRGELFFTLTDIQLNQIPTQSNPGGMTDTYLESGTYLKSFFTVMMAPSSVKIRMMGQSGRRLHHSILWENTVPKIISPKHRKK
jgi:hypothetical protein